MQIYPAIDMIHGQCVRLQQGKFDHVTVYETNPLAMVEKFLQKGASYLHIVDLDGARVGHSVNREVIGRIIKKFQIPIQTGGGIRTMDDIAELVDMGIGRVILGTVAVKNPKLVEEAVKLYPGKIAVGVDATGGMVAIEGWEKISNIKAVDLCRRMKEYGVDTIIYTDISKDGMMAGPSVDSTQEIIQATGLNIIASGGISSIKDLEEVYNIGAAGAIVGKALYQGRLDLEDAVNKFER